MIKARDSKFLVGVDERCYEMYTSIMKEKEMKKEAT